MTPRHEVIGPCTLWCGDALTILPTLDAGSVHLIICDPPYYRCKTDYLGEKIAWDRQWPTRDAYLSWLRSFAKAWQRVLAPNGSLYCFTSSRMAAHVEVMLGELFNVLQSIVWRKPPFSTKAEMFSKEDLRMFFPASERLIFCEQYAGDAQAMGTSGDATRCQQLHAHVFTPLGRYIQTERERAGFTQNQVDVGLGYVEKHNPTRGSRLIQRWEEGSSLPTKAAYERLRTFLNQKTPAKDAYLRREYEDLRREYEDLRRPFTLSAAVPYTDVWDFATVAYEPGKHPCEKPLPLLRHLIEASSRPGDLVLDPCAGSFSTLEAARDCGRHALGIEQDPRWYARGQHRLAQLPLWHMHPPGERPEATV